MIEISLREMVEAEEDEADFAAIQSILFDAGSLVRTDEPLESDASFREQVAPVAAAIGDDETFQAILIATGAALDQLGLNYGLIRGGLRRNDEEASPPPAPK